jgi:glyoxylase-like metal-dependent hydrolase (beta-lactamase superfamily II)
LIVVLRHLAGRVWWFPHHPDPNNVEAGVAVVAGDGGSVVVDAGNSPAAGRRIRAAIVAAGLPPPHRLVYTHHHWDHTWGACAWPDVEVVGHAAGARLLEAEARRPWSHAYLRAEVEANPRLLPSFRARAWAMSTWDDFRIVPPHVEFDGTFTLADGVVAHHVGGGHAPDTTVVTVPDSGVLLFGDAIYPPPAHLRGPDDGYDLAVAAKLLALGDFDWYLGSHEEPHSRTAVVELLSAT